MRCVEFCGRFGSARMTTPKLRRTMDPNDPAYAGQAHVGSWPSTTLGYLDSWPERCGGAPPRP